MAKKKEPLFKVDTPSFGEWKIVDGKTINRTGRNWIVAVTNRSKTIVADCGQLTQWDDANARLVVESFNMYEALKKWYRVETTNAGDKDELEEIMVGILKRIERPSLEECFGLAEELYHIMAEGEVYEGHKDFKMPQSVLRKTAKALQEGYDADEFQRHENGALYYSGMIDDYGGYLDREFEKHMPKDDDD